MRLSDQTLSSLTAALTHASRAYRAAADKVAADYGLSQATGLPVLVISRFGDGGVRPGILAETLSLEASSLVRVVDHLIGSGLVERHGFVSSFSCSAGVLACGFGRRLAASG